MRLLEWDGECIGTNFVLLFLSITTQPKYGDQTFPSLCLFVNAHITSAMGRLTPTMENVPTVTLVLTDHHRDKSMPTNLNNLPTELKLQIWQEVFQYCWKKVDNENFPDGPLGCARMNSGIIVYASNGRYAVESKAPLWLLHVLYVDSLSRGIAIDLLMEISDTDSHDDNFKEKWFEGIPTSPKQYYQLYVRDFRR